MPAIPYNLNVPNPPNNPSQDVTPMQTNTNSINTWIGVDHFQFSDVKAGWHNILHIPAQGSDPAPVTSPANAGQVYVKSVSSDLQLFYEDQLGNVSQITGNAFRGGGAGSPPTYNATITFPPKIKIICGNNVIAPGGTAVTFPNGGFGAACYAVTISINDAGAASTDRVVLSTTGTGYPSSTTFNAQVNASGSRNCSWIAMGSD